MNKLIVLSGISGSGKTFKAQQLVHEMERATVCSYDCIRIYHCNQLAPEKITMALMAEAGSMLRMGYTVIVDACNLHHHDRLRWEAIAVSFDVELQWLAIDTPLDVCIERDKLRCRPVGARRITAQYDEFIVQYGDE